MDPVSWLNRSGGACRVEVSFAASLQHGLDHGRGDAEGAGVQWHTLVRAGLVPALAKRPPGGRGKARIAILVPGSEPLRTLASVLARIATNDPLPVRKTRELAEELALPNAAGEYDGLQRIASLLPEADL